MHATSPGERTLTQPDFARLSKLPGRPLSAPLVHLLASAEVASSRSIRGDVVTMHSRVELVNTHTRRRQTLTVCYPEDAEPAAGWISVLSPAGSSLLGLQAGDKAVWQTSTGEECSAEVAVIAFQPESAGDYAT